jgi:hypothetical protein
MAETAATSRRRSPDVLHDTDEEIVEAAERGIAALREVQ